MKETTKLIGTHIDCGGNIRTLTLRRKKKLKSGEVIEYLFQSLRCSRCNKTPRLSEISYLEIIE